MSQTYQCPKGCFGTEPFRCDHGGSGKAPASARSSQATLTQAVEVLKALAKARQPLEQSAPGQWARYAPVVAVQQRYAADREKVAAAKAKRRAMPLGPHLVVADGVLISAAEFLAAGNP